MISGLAIPHHLYADDSLPYVSFSSGDCCSTEWLTVMFGLCPVMDEDKLELNPDKTEVFLIGKDWQHRKYLSIELLGVKTNPAQTARNLGVYLTNISPFLRIYQQCASNALNICGICGVVAVTLIWIVQMLASALVSSHLDYCNSLLYGIADMDVTKLQQVQNWLARIVTKSPPFTRSVPLLRSLHWLPVKFRILFKISLLTYKTIHERQPVYIHSMLAVSLPSHSPRSSKGISLSVPRVKTNSGARAFHSCAPSLWNNLPLSIRSAISVAAFKKHLKTHLFDLAFSP